MRDFTKLLPDHIEKTIGENDLFLEIFKGRRNRENSEKKPPLLFVHGAYTGSWMWSKYLPHFINEGWDCYVMNLRSHYKSRVMDISRVTFEDYLEDIKENLELIQEECEETPIIIGFSLGGILVQKIAETTKLAGLILIDSVINKEVNEMCPYEDLVDMPGMIQPAPERKETSSIDESEEDIIFQRKYLSMESSLAIIQCGCWIKGIEGMSINNKLISCKTLVLKSVNSNADDKRGYAEAEHLNGEYTGFWSLTHTGLLVGQRYQEVVSRILSWLNSCPWRVL